jgi:hypothetical protein
MVSWQSFDHSGPGLIVGPRDESDRFHVLACADRSRRGRAGAWKHWKIPCSSSMGVILLNGHSHGREPRDRNLQRDGPAKPLGIGGMLDGIKDALKVGREVYVGERRIFD